MENEEYSDKVSFKIIVEKSSLDYIQKEIINATNGKAEINKDEEDIYFKENNRLFKEID